MTMQVKVRALVQVRLREGDCDCVRRQRIRLFSSPIPAGTDKEPRDPDYPLYVSRGPSCRGDFDPFKEEHRVSARLHQ
jgi:hypothetical protein